MSRDQSEVDEIRDLPWDPLWELILGDENIKDSQDLEEDRGSDGASDDRPQADGDDRIKEAATSERLPKYGIRSLFMCSATEHGDEEIKYSHRHDLEERCESDDSRDDSPHCDGDDTIKEAATSEGAPRGGIESLFLCGAPEQMEQQEKAEESWKWVISLSASEDSTNSRGKNKSEDERYLIKGTAVGKRPMSSSWRNFFKRKERYYPCD